MLFLFNGFHISPRTRKKLIQCFKCRPSQTRQYVTPRAHASLVPETPARTRFAPSPTGYLHLGSLRTALFSYLLAKRTGGQFLLRLEDTDKKRTVVDAEKRLYEDLKWAGLEWDEGPIVGGPYGPYRQSERTQIYYDHAQNLLQSGHGYRCFCNTDRLNELVQQRTSLGVSSSYDRLCAGIPESESTTRASRGEPNVIRLKVPDKYRQFVDLAVGKVSHVQSCNHAQNAFDDPILLKSDGYPTYHLANVVDDHEMKITHVVRGTEWLSATPKHLALYDAFGWTPPNFAHVGLLTNEDGSKLSKRNDDITIESYRERGVLPEALTNFVALLGWSHQEASDIMSLKDLEEKFSLKFTKGNTTVAAGKLWFLQGRHAEKRVQVGGSQLEDLVNICLQRLKVTDTDSSAAPEKFRADAKIYVSEILKADSKNYRGPSEFLKRNAHFFRSGLKGETSLEEAAQGLDSIRVSLAVLSAINESDWNQLAIHEALQKSLKRVLTTEEEKISNAGSKESAPNYSAKFFWKNLRRAIAGGADGPTVTNSIVILGRSEVLKRLESSISYKS